MKRSAIITALYTSLFAAGIALSAGTALAASPPEITQTSSWNVGSTTAGISMTVRNQNQNSRQWFEYSTNSNLADAKRVGEIVEPPIAGGLGVHATLSGLRPETVYYFRGFIRNYDGEKYSAINSFRTAAGAAAQPSVSFDKGQMNGNALALELTCNGGGAEGTCSIFWSMSANMGGERELKGDYVRSSPVGTKMYASFGVGSVPDNTRVYFQGVMKTAIGTARTGVHDFTIRNKPI